MADASAPAVVPAQAPAEPAGVKKEGAGPGQAAVAAEPQAGAAPVADSSPTTVNDPVAATSDAAAVPVKAEVQSTSNATGSTMSQATPAAAAVSESATPAGPPKTEAPAAPEPEKPVPAASEAGPAATASSSTGGAATAQMAEAAASTNPGAGSNVSAGAEASTSTSAADAGAADASKQDKPSSNENPNKPGKLIGSDRPPLNVRDALTYLDSVKARFLDKPEYYNSFLDIMKDFKTMNIDTPGVIDRVSSLFRFHPSLISNFNLFLPDGFRLDCEWEDEEKTSAASITVITPAGLQYLPRNRSSNLTGIDLPGRIEPTELTHAISGRYVYSQKAPPKANRAAQTAKAAADKRAATAEAKAKAAEEKKAAAAKKSAAAAAAAKAALAKPKEAPKAGPAPMQTSRAEPISIPSEKRPAIEFNHAISYVNKIKTRFVEQPEIYKSFLDILQTYQKEQKPIQDVYAQVTKLFKSAPDLLDEFKQFLPDHSQEGREAAKEAEKKAAAQTSRVSQARSKPAGPPSVVSDDAGPAGGTKRKRAPGQDRAGPAAIQPVAQPTVPPAKAVKARSRAAPGGPKDPPTAVQQSSSRFEVIPGQSAAGPGYPQPILSYLPPGYTLPGTGAGATGQLPAPLAQETPEEKMFFDRIADFIDDKFTYYEFLKLLNLYTQEIIDLPTLVSRAWLFIGSAPDLWMDFREVVGWKDGANVNGRVIENGEWIVENVPAIDKRDKWTDLTRCEASGPSYRRLPKHEINMQCSGRDSLCQEVLNDEWVSVPNMGAEEVFLASRKNPFEEALHRSEDERHEYDFHIEANLRTIALLEPIAARIATMEPEERLTFRLKPGLGNQSKSIYQRIIKKVYGKDMGREVIQALHENPCTSVPIVLARLKQKDEEWKRALREWNRVWREVDAKNFYRSLDHQGINFKAQDKRYIASKAMVSEIEVMRRTELQRQISAPPRYRPPPPTYQLAFPISDENVLFDSLKLFLSYLDRAPGYHTTAERDRIEAFLRSLTSLVFAIPVSVLDSMLTPVQDDSRSVTASDDEDGMSDSASATDGGLHPGARGRTGTPSGLTAAKKAADLRKKAMKNATGRPGRPEGDATPATSRDSTPAPGQGAAAAGISPTDTPMADADVQPSTRSDAQSLLEVQQNGESSYKVDVPASAAGLQGMTGVETVKTAPAQEDMQVDPSAATPPTATSTPPQGDPAPAILASQLPPQRPDLQHIQTKSETMLNGPAGVTVSSLQSAPESINGADVHPSQASPPIPLLQNAQPRGEPQIRRFNFFCNTPYYCAIRLLHLLYSRLHSMKEAARALGSTASKDALSNSSFTLHGRANPRFSNQDATPPTVLYDNMLELCEKLFGGELDQPTFEDNVRGLFGNKAYEIFTIDKLLSALVKTVWSLIDSNREAYSANGDIFKLLVDDRRYPTTAQAQQITYRINAELAAGSDENLYRVEWMPRRHLLTFQLLGKDEILPEDEADLSKVWERYIESFVNDDITAGLTIPAKTIAKSARLYKNLRTVEAKREELPRLVARSELESRICLRSYRIFWQGKTQDAMHRDWSDQMPAGMTDVNEKRKTRFSKWLSRREKALETAAVEAAGPSAGPAAPTAEHKPSAVPTVAIKETAAAAPSSEAAPSVNKEASAEPPQEGATQPAAEVTVSAEVAPEGDQANKAVEADKPAEGAKAADPTEESKPDASGDVSMAEA